MVDAFSRLFGKGSKKVPPSPSDQGSDHAVSEDEGFTVVGGAPKDRPHSYAGPPNNASPYPALPQQENSPYPIRGVAPTSGPGPGGYNTLSSQSSVTMPHVLDGVPFELSPRCSSSGRTRELDALLADATTKLDAAQSLIQSSNYDFRLEKNVIDSDISATMRRMQTY